MSTDHVPDVMCSELALDANNEAEAPRKRGTGKKRAPKRKVASAEPAKTPSPKETSPKKKSPKQKSPEKANKKRATKGVTKKPRYPSSYILFNVAKRREFIEENPKLKIGEVSKLCGAAWAELSAEEKAKWAEEAQRVKAERQLTEKSDEDEEEPVAPKKKRPLSGYLLFSISESKKVRAERAPVMQREVARECGQRWNALAAEEREAWKNKALDLAAQNVAAESVEAN